jgi:hypothetical protein
MIIKANGVRFKGQFGLRRRIIRADGIDMALAFLI